MNIKKFVAKSKDVLKALKNNNQVAFRYCSKEGAKAKFLDNPNGSVEDIAGITDVTGRILGLMPHPERHFLFTHHPFWTRLKQNGQYGQGAKIFENEPREKTVSEPTKLAMGDGSDSGA